MPIESVMPSNHVILCRPLLLLPSVFPSIRVFSNESALCIRWPKYWNFSFNVSSSSEHSGLMFFRMDWLDLLTVQGTLSCFLIILFPPLNGGAAMPLSWILLLHLQPSPVFPLFHQDLGMFKNTFPLKTPFSHSHALLCLLPY